MKQIQRHKAFSIAARRLPFVSYNFIYSLLPSIFSFIVSYMVVRIKGVGIWGEYVYISTVVSLIALVAQWGNKDQLLRDFSFKPSGMVSQWYANIVARSILLFLLLIVSFFIFKGPIAIYCVLWLLLLWAGRIVEVLYVYQKRFSYLLAVEIVYWVATGIILAIYYYKLSLQFLLEITLISTLIKVVLLHWNIKGVIYSIPAFTPNWSFPAQGLTFFILALTGLLEARTDIFCINLLIGKEGVGKYSLLFNLLLLLKNLPDFFVGPFIKNFYRSDKKVFDKISWQLGLSGIIISVTGVFVFRYFFEWMYKLHYSWPFYGMAVLYVLPRFMFSMNIFRLFQQKREYLLVVGTLTGLAVNAALDFSWLKTYGIESVMGAAAIGQWVMLAFFKIIAAYPFSVSKTVDK